MLFQKLFVSLQSELLNRYCMKYPRVLFAALLLAVLAAGCGAYNPVCVDIPLISQRGELQIEGAVLPTGGSSRITPVEVRGSVAYGFTDHFAAGFHADPFRHYTQLTAGAFFPSGEKFVWEVYGGVGVGNGEKYVDYDPGCSDYSNYRLLFVQADAGWLNLTRFLNLDVAFSLKSGLINVGTEFGDGTYYSDDINQWVRRHHDVYGNRFMLEPTAEVRFGWEQFKFNVKIGWTYVFNNTGDHYLLPYSSIAIGAGVSMRFNTRKN